MSRIDEELEQAVRDNEAGKSAVRRAAADVANPVVADAEEQKKSWGLLAGLVALGAGVLLFVFNSGDDAVVYAYQVDDLKAQAGPTQNQVVPLPMKLDTSGPGPSTGAGTFDQGAIERVVATRKAGVKRICLDRNRSSAASTKVTATLTIAPSGTVQNVSTTGDDPVVGKCIEQQLRSWSFPREKVKLAINHANVANSVKERDVVRTLEYEVFWQIPYDESVTKSTQLGQPIVLTKPNSRVGANIIDLARMMGGVRPRQKTFMDRFLKR